jgi:hypothetical protein
MYQESHYISLVEPILTLQSLIGQVVAKYNLPISGMLRDGYFYPDINPYPFMEAIVSSYFEKKSVALESISGSAYPQSCYECLKGWGIPQPYWDPICREVFNMIFHTFLSILPSYRQDDSTTVQFGIADTDDLMLWITYHA